MENQLCTSGGGSVPNKMVIRSSSCLDVTCNFMIMDIKALVVIKDAYQIK
jgi:hypothetical protein